MHDIITPARAPSRRIAKKKVVFISHSWEDRAIVQPFKDAFFGTNSLLDASRYELFYSSDPLDPSVSPGENIWQKTEEQLFRCEHFVAFCSPNYFKSQTCQNELGAFKVLSATTNKKSAVHMIPVKLANYQSKYFNYIIGPGMVHVEDFFDPKGVALLTRQLSSALSTTIADNDPRCKDVAEKAAEARDKLDQSKDHRIVSLWQKHLNDKSYPNAPVTFFIEVCQYPKVAVGLSEKGQRSVVWALNRSPLLAIAAYADSSSYLMEHDRLFQSLKAPNKYRLVIFEDWKEADAYHRCDLDYHKGVPGWDISISSDQLVQRRKKFEESVGNAHAKLLFTTRTRLRNRALFEFADSLGEDYWDFGYVKTDVSVDDEFLFVSGFDSPSFANIPAELHSGVIRHLALYSKPHDDRYKVFQEKPAYSALYGPFRCLFDVVHSLLNPSNATANVFVTESNIYLLADV